MSTKKKLLQAAAGAAGSAGLDVDEVFSTYLYEGNQTARTITNGIDLAGEGGLTWITPRETNAEMQFIDSERGVASHATPILISSMTNGEISRSDSVKAYNSDGFDLGTYDATNYSSRDMVSWTFRKAPKFFDVVTYTGTGVNGRTVSHNLGAAPGMIIVKQYSAAGEPWYVYHRSLGGTKRIYLNTTGTAGTTDDGWFDTEPTSTEFTVAYNGTNKSGASYVAYLFAHNNSDGDFGPDSDQDIIKCGSFTASSSKTASVNLGFEPQWLMIKSSSVAEEWIILDNMRGLIVDRSDHALFANATTAEETGKNYVNLTATGFDITDNVTGSADYIYIAIRRGPLAEPESATDVFAIDQRGGTSPTPPMFNSGFVTDFAIWFNTATNPKEMNYRLGQGVSLDVNASTAQHAQSSRSFDYMNGWGDFSSSVTSQYAWMWKRAPSFCDVATYSGNNQSSAITVNHNLGVVPEMMWCKKRGASGDWMVYHKDLNGGTNPHTYRLRVNSTGGEGTGSGVWNAAPTATQFSVGTDYDVNSGTVGHVTFLFATLAGISKVGSYTGNGSSLTIDCGFSSGARFVLIKKISGTSPWLCFDTERGIVTGNENAILLDQTTAQNSADYIDPSSSGFIVNLTYSEADQYNPNQTSGEYIFYAIA